MAPIGRQSDSPLKDRLFQSGFQFDFFQAVRLLGRLYSKRKAIGGLTRPSEEIVRFGAWLSMNFPASAVDYIEAPPEGKDIAPRMTVTFFGLTGTQGILPLHYTERLLALKASKDTVLADFFDLFNHRLISLFYRAWAKYRPPLIWETAAREQHKPDAFTHYVFDFIGLGTDAIRRERLIPDESLLPYAGLISQRPHSASALRGILRDYFSAPVEIDQYLGSWYELAEDDRCYLAPELERSQLGVGAFLGDQVWNQQDRFRIRIGPVGFNRFRDFLPTGPALAKLIELTRFLVGQALAFDVQVVLKKEEVPFPRLEDGPRLGWTSWLKTSEFRVDAADAVFAKVM